MRGIFAASHEIGKFTFLGRANYYGEYTASNCVPNNCSTGLPTVFETQTLGEEVLFDLEASYVVTGRLTFSIGARNVFDEYPDPGEYRMRETSNGRKYRSGSVVDWMGGFYYGKIKYRF